MSTSRVQVAREVARARTMLADAGLLAGVLVRDLDTGEELGILPDLELPVASLVKLPIALATLERIRRGDLDGAAQVTVEPTGLVGPPGITMFRHPATVAVDDLIYLAVSVSDSSAADALLDLTPPAEATAVLTGLGIRGIEVRHGLGTLSETPAEVLAPDVRALAYAVATRAGGPRGGSAIPQLDLSVANVASPRAFVDMLAEIWTGTAIADGVSARLRELLGANVHRHRLAPEFVSDRSTWSSKTGTALNLRHEAGVVEHADGGRYAVAVLSRSNAPAGVQPGVDIVLGRVARTVHDLLRR